MSSLGAFRQHLSSYKRWIVFFCADFFFCWSFLILHGCFEIAFQEPHWQQWQFSVSPEMIYKDKTFDAMLRNVSFIFCKVFKEFLEVFCKFLGFSGVFWSFCSNGVLFAMEMQGRFLSHLLCQFNERCGIESHITDEECCRLVHCVRSALRTLNNIHSLTSFRGLQWGLLLSLILHCHLAAWCFVVIVLDWLLFGGLSFDVCWLSPVSPSSLYHLCRCGLHVFK